MVIKDKGCRRHTSRASVKEYSKSIAKGGCGEDKTFENVNEDLPYLCSSIFRER